MAGEPEGAERASSGLGRNATTQFAGLQDGSHEMEAFSWTIQPEKIFSHDSFLFISTQCGVRAESQPEVPGFRATKRRRWRKEAGFCAIHTEVTAC
jgi:hypothetical protein